MKRGDVRMARGFTVLELLLTLTVGALVTVAATGLYRWSRLQADIAVSSRNLRQLAAANLNYAQDHNGRYCPAQDQSNLRRWHGGRKKMDEAFEAAGQGGGVRRRRRHVGRSGRARAPRWGVGPQQVGEIDLERGRRPGIGDGGLDLGPVAHNPGVGH